MAYKFNPLSGQIEDQSQGVQGPTGTVTAATDGGNDNPGIAFNDESNTGFYRIGGGTIGVTCTGTTSLRIDNSGRLSVVPNTNNYGVIQPLTSSDDKGLALYAGPNQTYTTGAAIRLTGAGNGGNVRIHGSNAAVTKGNIQLWTGANASLVIENTGNVGIGQSAPSSDYRVTIRSGTSPHSPLFLDTSESNYNTNLYFAKQGTAKWIIGNTATGDDFRFVSSSDERLRITSDGNVGIGTISPSKALDVVGTGSVLIKAKRDNTGTASGGVEIGNNDRTWTLFGDNDYFTLYDNGSSSSPLVVKNDGKVGIGTDSPNQLLDIRANATDTRIQIGPASTSNALAQLPNNSEYGLAIAHGNAELGLHKDGSGNHSYVMGTWTSEDIPLVFRTGSRQERLRITNTGKIGIGTETPSTDVVLSNGGEQGVEFSYPSTNKVEINAYNRDSSTRTHIDLVGQDFKVLTGNPTLNTGLYQDSSGKVGIGTDSPSTELHVKGAGTVAQFEGTGGSAFIQFVDSDDGTIAFIGADGGDLKFQTPTNAYSDKLTIKNDGKIGINTTDTSGNATVVIDSQLGGGSVLRFIGKSSNDGSEIDFYADNNSTRLGYLEFNNTVTKLVSETDVPLSFYTNGGSNERLRINSDGIVTLKGPTNANALEINTGSGSGSLVINRGGAITSNIRASDGNSNIGDAVNAGGSRLRLWKNQILFDTYPASAALGYTPVFTERLTIHSNGNIGIGATNPQAELHVRDAAPVFRIEDSTHGFYSELSVEDSGSLVLNADAGNGAADSKVIIKTDGTERASFDVNGTAAFTGDVTLATDKELKFGDGNFKVWRSSNGNNYINSPSNNSLIIQAQGNTAVEVKNNKDVEFTGQVRVGSTGGHNLNASTGLELRGPAIGSGGVSTDHFKALKLALNDSSEWGGQAVFSLGRWEEPASTSDEANDARSSLKISLGHGAQNSGSDPDADVLLLKSDKSATFTGDVGIGADPAGAFKLYAEGGDSDEGLFIHTGSSSSQWLIRAENNAGTQQFVVKADGEAIFGGNIKVADDKGIDFSSYDGNDTTGTVSTPDGNILKDYEEGTFSPLMKEGSNEVWDTSGDKWKTNVGNYTKIGRIVHVDITFQWSDLASGTNSNTLSITGLPFSLADITSYRAVATVGYIKGLDFETNEKQLIIKGSANGSLLEAFFLNDDNVEPTQVKFEDLDSSYSGVHEWQLSLTYQTD
jgi:hypothetical protein